MKKVILLVSCLGLGLFAATPVISTNVPVKTENKMVNKNSVEMESYSHQKRVEILQKADSCIKSAKTQDDYKKCEEIEKQGRENLKGEMFSKRKTLMIEETNERIKKLESFKSCVSAAKDGDTLKTCYPKKD
jgi:flagellar motility protein MotE (MotC chaperone)